MKIINKQPVAFLKNLEKAFYKDNYQNRKLGRVGRPYEHKEENEKSWDKIEDFYKDGSTENKLWQSWYRLQKTGDHSWMGVFRDILAQKFPKVKSWSQTAPNTGKKVITAKDRYNNTIASIDLSGDKIDLPTLQTFMDKCHNASKLEDIEKENEKLNEEYENILSKYLDYDIYFESKKESPSKKELEEFYSKQEDAFNQKADEETKEKVEKLLDKIKNNKDLIDKLNWKKDKDSYSSLIEKTTTLKEAKGPRLDAIIKYSNSAEEEGVEGIKVANNATDEEKRIAIAKFYKEAAEGDAENLDEIIEEALADYVPEKD